MNKKLNSTFELLELERAHIFQYLDETDQEVLVKQPTALKWSVVQVIDHMIQVDKASLLYLNKKIKAGASIPKASWSSSLRTFILTLFLRSPVKFKAPKGLEKPVNDKNLRELLLVWNAVREDMHKFLDDFPDNLLNRAIYKHPVSGRITLEQTLQFLRTHQQHHLAQVKRTLQSVNV